MFNNPHLSLDKPNNGPTIYSITLLDDSGLGGVPSLFRVTVVFYVGTVVGTLSAI